MDARGILTDAFGRIGGVVRAVVDDLDADELAARPDPDANTIAWLVWHLTRIQDDHIAGAAGTDQVWTSSDWPERFGLPFDDSATGYGQSSTEVGAVRPFSADLLTGYYNAVEAKTLSFLKGLDDDDLDRVVDESWDPPVTLGVRLVSVIADDLQHAGQAAYVSGLLERHAEPD